MNKTLTFGQKAVGLSFNPSNDSLVDHFKVKLADLIDEANAVRETSDDPEVNEWHLSLSLSYKLHRCGLLKRSLGKLI
ncbi:hypothetical protein J4731_23260 [Providencia rettgeri]|nr:hypothetical protein [Providencia rettgeri]